LGVLIAFFQRGGPAPLGPPRGGGDICRSSRPDMRTNQRSRKNAVEGFKALSCIASSNPEEWNRSPSDGSVDQGRYTRTFHAAGLRKSLRLAGQIAGMSRLAGAANDGRLLRTIAGT